MPRDSLDQSAHRVAAIDVARCLGIFLVYHGHIVERMMYLGNEAAAAQYKFIYSFHMPLFFVLAGYIAKDLAATQSVVGFLKSRLMSRLLPLLFFNLLLALSSLAIPRDFPPIPLETTADYGNALVMSVTWLPVFNVPTWFLMCLVTVEALHFLLFRFVRRSSSAIALLMVACFVAGMLLNQQAEFFPGRNWWFWNEAPVVYAFYLLGVLLRRLGTVERPVPWALSVLVGFAALLAVYLTYDLNQGPFRLGIEAVVVLAAGHGHPMWFPMTAILGTLAILFLARALRRAPGLAYLGRNALVLFCLNGVFYHHVNGPLAQWYVEAAPEDGWSLAVFAAVASAASIALTVPILRLFDRWIPQLIGQPTRSGPLLPRLL